MKVFHVLSNPGVGGVEGMLSELIPRVGPAKCDMRVINMRSKSVAYELWDRCGILYHRLQTPSKWLFPSIIVLARLLRCERPDIIEIYGLRANIVARLAAKIARVPVILTGVLSTDDWRKWYHVWLDRATSWAVSGWIANSQACKRSQIEREKHPAERIEVIYDGIDVSYWTKGIDEEAGKALRSEWGYDKENVVYVTVANLRPDKGVQYLIEAIPGVLAVEPKVRFVLVGSDWMRGRLQRRCQELGIEKVVRFAGFRSDIRTIYEAADATVLPSIREGLPICLIKAMSMELPVIASAVSGTPELVDDGNTGMLVPPKDVKALVKALIEIASSAEQRKQMGQAERQRVSEMFTIERMMDELLDYYQQQFRLAANKDS